MYAACRQFTEVYRAFIAALPPADRSGEELIALAEYCIEKANRYRAALDLLLEGLMNQNYKDREEIERVKKLIRLADHERKLIATHPALRSQPANRPLSGPASERSPERSSRG
jgi:hypothetical protein